MNSHLLPLFVFYKSSVEKLIKYQADSSCLIMSVILMTTMSYMALILQGEIWCWSLLGLQGVKAKEPSIFLLAAGLVFKAEKEFADQRISHICWLFLQRFGGAEKGRGIGWSHVHADTKKTSRTLAINEMSFQSWNHETVAIARGRYPRALAPRSFLPLQISEGKALGTK